MSTTVVASAYGGPDVLTVIDESVPDPGEGQVLVEFTAVGVNPVDYKVYGGAFGEDPDALPLHLGREGAGVVVAVGPNAIGPAGPIGVGDEVIVYPGSGTYAKRALQAADSVLPKSTLSWEQAGGLLLTGSTAYDTVETTGVSEGDVVLIHGAAGGVGLLAVQLARLRGATVIGTARESSHEYLRSIGAIPVTYGDGLVDRVRAAAPEGIDAAIDTVGTDEAVDVSLQLVADKSRIATIAAFGRVASTGIVALGAGNPASAELRNRVRTELIDLVAGGQITNVIAKTFPLTDAAKAHEELQKSHPIGKFVLIP